MRVKSVNNPDQIITWNTRESNWPQKTESSCRSKIQFQIGQIIKQRYPLDPVLEDITIPDTRLSLDFFIPHRKLAVEVQGEQHDQMNPYFHKSNAEFEEQKERDELKRFFCELNSIKLLEIRTVKDANKYFYV
jgi:hypothetical protein